MEKLEQFLCIIEDELGEKKSKSDNNNRVPAGAKQKLRHCPKSLGRKLPEIAAWILIFSAFAGACTSWRIMFVRDRRKNSPRNQHKIEPIYMAFDCLLRRRFRIDLILLMSLFSAGL